MREPSRDLSAFPQPSDHQATISLDYRLPRAVLDLVRERHQQVAHQSRLQRPAAATGSEVEYSLLLRDTQRPVQHRDKLHRGPFPVLAPARQRMHCPPLRLAASFRASSQAPFPQCPNRRVLPLRLSRPLAFQRPHHQQRPLEQQDRWPLHLHHRIRP